MVNIKRIPIILFSLLSFTPLLAQTQKGKATFYSKRATGARTASGARLHHDSMTCAHRTHPFGTLLKVTNLTNDKWVVVKVTDRGPYVRGRIIDLSWRAAKELEILAKGVCMVKVEVFKEAQGIPYRLLEGVKMPELDFEITEAGYSFTEEWAERMKVSDMPELPSRKKEKKAPAHKKAAPQKTETKKPTDKHTDTKKEEGNTWSNIFESLKKTSGDIF